MNTNENTTAVLIGRRLQQKRTALSLSITDLSKLTAIPRGTLQNYEAGIRTAPLKALKTLGAALKTSPAWLATLTDLEGESDSLAYSPVDRIGQHDQQSVAFNVSVLEAKRLSMGTLATLKIEDSFLTPDLPKGAEVLINTAVKSIDKTDIYAVKDDSGRVMCLWGRKEIGKDEYVIYANDDTHFPPIRITGLESIEIVGRVVAVVTWR